MASNRIVRHVTEALLGILRSQLSVPPSPIVLESNVKAAPPEEIEAVGEETLILYLYQVVESPFLRNVGPRQELAPVTNPDQSRAVVSRKDPLALDLYYLLIPGAPTEPANAYLDTYDILGAAMLAFHDQGTFRLGEFAPSTTLSADEVNLPFRIDFNRLDMADLARVWEAVQKPYRLSVSYVVRTLQLDSRLTDHSQLVSARGLQLEQK